MILVFLIATDSSHHRTYFIVRFQGKRQNALLNSQYRCIVYLPEKKETKH